MQQTVRGALETGSGLIIALEYPCVKLRNYCRGANFLTQAWETEYAAGLLHQYCFRERNAIRKKRNHETW